MPPSSLGQHNFTFRLIVLLGSLSALTALSTDIYLPALSSVGENLNATSLELQLTLGIFLIGYGFGQLFFGPLSDSLGRRPVLLFGIYLYTIASIACALSTHIDFLILNRLLQALGGCATAVTTRAIVRDSHSRCRPSRTFNSPVDWWSYFIVLSLARNVHCIRPIWAYFNITFSPLD